MVCKLNSDAVAYFCVYNIAKYAIRYKSNYRKKNGWCLYSLLLNMKAIFVLQIG